MRAVRDLKIVTYDEIDPEQAMLLDFVCFGFPTPSVERTKLIRKLDTCCSDYYCLYALNDDGQVVSQVGVLHLDTETVEGPERIGGIWGVATLPGYARQGFSTAVMKRAHELIREHGLRISMLTTGADLVAYGMYSKLGYSTLATFQRGIKRLTPRRSKKSSLRLRKFSGKDSNALDRMFNSQNTNALGFVRRPRGFMAMKLKTQQITPEKIKVAASNGVPVGYLRYETEADTVTIRELIGLDDSTLEAALLEFETQSKARWAFARGICDRRLTKVLEKAGYRLYQPGYGCVMAASVDGSLTEQDIANLYGKSEGRFVLSSLDSF
jgi:predicted acetyltransferase